MHALRDLRDRTSVLLVSVGLMCFNFEASILVAWVYLDAPSCCERSPKLVLLFPTAVSTQEHSASQRCRFFKLCYTPFPLLRCAVLFSSLVPVTMTSRVFCRRTFASVCVSPSSPSLTASVCLCPWYLSLCLPPSCPFSRPKSCHQSDRQRRVVRARRGPSCRPQPMLPAPPPPPGAQPEPALKRLVPRPGRAPRQRPRRRVSSGSIFRRHHSPHTRVRCGLPRALGFHGAVVRRRQWFEHGFVCVCGSGREPRQ